MADTVRTRLLPLSESHQRLIPSIMEIIGATIRVSRPSDIHLRFKIDNSVKVRTASSALYERGSGMVISVKIDADRRLSYAAPGTFFSETH
jgi:hypothetical protein